VQDSILIFLPCSSLDWREWWESVSTVYKFLKLGKWGIFGDDIQWNFAKFLVNKDGQVVDRYYHHLSVLR
jgi:hypothetical protein